MDNFDKSKQVPKASTKAGKRDAQSAECKHAAIAVSASVEPPSKFIALASSFSAVFSFSFANLSFFDYKI